MMNESSNFDDTSEGKIRKPEIGMKFGGVEEVWEFYKSYAKEAGFPVRKASSKRNVFGEVRSCTFTCARGGTKESSSYKPLNPQATIRCGCLAKLVARLDQCAGWVISNTVLEHNHELSPDKARYFRCNRHINATSGQNTVEHERYNNLNILFTEIIDKAIKLEDEFSGIKQWLVMKLEMLKKREGSFGSEPKSPTTNEYQEGEEGDGGDDVAEEDNGVLDLTYKRRKGRPQCTRLQAPWINKNNTPNNEGNENNGGDCRGVIVPAPMANRCGKSPSCKNTSNPNGDGDVQKTHSCKEREKVEAYILRGIAQEKLGNYKEACEDFKRALHLQGHSTEWPER